MKTVKLTDKQWNTIYTALRLELGRCEVGDDETIKILKEAIQAFQNCETGRK